MRLFTKLGLFPLLLACATVSARAPFRFSDIESLDYRNSTVSELGRLFGKPDRVVNADPETDIWTYDELASSGERGQRMSFSVLRKDGKVVSGLWMMRPEDDLYRKEAVLSHFKTARFKSEVEGKIAHDTYSSDLIFSDRTVGVSFLLGLTQQSVQYVSFRAPTETARSLSTRE